VATDYEPERAEFSRDGHEAARLEVYPQFFRRLPEELAYEYMGQWDRPVQRFLDVEFGIDTIVDVPVDSLRAPLRVTFQERFLSRLWWPCLGVTVTAWNCDTGNPAELHKPGPDYFLCGCFDEGKMVDAYILDRPRFVLNLIDGEFKPRHCQIRMNHKSQEYWSIEPKELRELGCVAWSLKDQHCFIAERFMTEEDS